MIVRVRHSMYIPFRKTCLLALALTGGPADAADWTSVLEDSKQGSYRTPHQALRLNLGGSPPPPERLRLEVDAVDVTSMIQRDGNTLTYTPLESLAYGAHQLKLIETREDGSTEEHGSWDIEVRHSAAVRELSGSADTTLTGSTRVARDQLQSASSDLSGDGASTLAAGVAGDHAKANFSADVVVDSQQGDPGRDVDLGEFLLDGEAGPAKLRAGHHAIEHSSLVMESFRRRGVSGEYALPERLGTVNTFAFRTDQLTGLRNGLGVGRSERRVQGVSYDLKPFESKPEKFALSAIYLGGEGNDSGINVGTGSDVTPGSAYGLAARTQLLDDRLTLKAEGARTHFDFDGAGVGFRPEADNGYDVSAQWSSTLAAESERPFTYTLGLARSSVGTYFRSLANTTVPTDQRLSRLFGDVGWGVWSLSGSVAYETDNVRNDETLPRVGILESYLSAGYSAEAPSESRWLSWLGTQSYTLSTSLNDGEDIRKPRVLTDYVPTRQRVHDLSLESTYSYSDWNWGFGLNYGGLQDAADVQSDTRSLGGSLNASFSLGERIQLSPSFQYYNTDDVSLDSRYDTLTYGLDTDITLIPEKLRLSLNMLLMRSHSDDPDALSETSQAYFNTQLIYTLWKPGHVRPGLDLALSAVFDSNDDHIQRSLSTDSNQVFMNLIMTLPLAYPRATP